MNPPKSSSPSSCSRSCRTCSSVTCTLIRLYPPWHAMCFLFVCQHPVLEPIRFIFTSPESSVSRDQASFKYANELKRSGDRNQPIRKGFTARTVPPNNSKMAISAHLIELFLVENHLYKAYFAGILY